MRSDKKIVVTGSSGMLGVDLCSELAQNYKVIGFDASVPPCEMKGDFEFFKIDLIHDEQTAEKIKEIIPGHVIHLAAYTDVDGCELNPEKASLYNAEIAKHIAAVCRKEKIGLVFISTDFVFDGEKRRPYKESDKTNPLSIYGRTKLEAEQYIKRTCGDFYIFRSAWLFGKYGKNFARTIAERARRGENLKVVNDQSGCPTYTKDLSLGLSKFMRMVLDGQRFESGIFHLVNSGSCSWYEYAKVIVEEIGAGVEVTPISSEELNRPALRPKWSVLDCGKFEELTTVKLPHWKDSLVDYLKSEKFI